MDEERAVTLLQKAELGRLSAEETRWLERWLEVQQSHWASRLLHHGTLRRAAPPRLRESVRRALLSQSESSATTCGPRHPCLETDD